MRNFDLPIWEDKGDWLICTGSSSGKILKRRKKPFGPDGKPMEVFRDYRAVALRSFSGSYVRKGSEINATLIPSGVIYLDYAGDGVFCCDGKEGKDFKFVKE